MAAVEVECNELITNVIMKEEKTRTEDVILPADCRCVDFESLLLLPAILNGIKKMGFVRPSPIQLEAIPVGRCGFDLVVQAKSGTGKTCVFSVIALESLNQSAPCLQVMILAPTREIVMQVADVIRSMGRAMLPFICSTFIGGLPISEDRQKVKNCQIAVGTPGRIKQLMSEHLLKTNAVRLFVLDEADKLLEENFQNDINWIYHKLPSTKQMMAFSATYPETLAQLLAKYMQSPTFIRLNAKNPALRGIKQYYKITPYHPLQSKSFENKVSHVSTLLSSLPFGQCMIFSNYQMRAQGLCDRLNALGWPATFICGKMAQTDRLQAISKFRDFKCRILISTDLTARGIDIECVNLVINLDVPYDVETYFHRIGRAGRFGTFGIVVTFATKGEEMQYLQELKEKGNLNITELPDQLNADLWDFKKTIHDSDNSNVTSEKLDSFLSSNSYAEPSVIDESVKFESHSTSLVKEELHHNISTYECPLGEGTIQNDAKNASDVEKQISAQAHKLQFLRLENCTHDSHDSQLEKTDAISDNTVVNSAISDSMSVPYDEVRENVTVEHDDLVDLEAFLNIPSCEECDVCRQGASKLSEIACKSESLFDVDNRKMEEFLSTAHSKFLSEIKDGFVLPESQNSATVVRSIIENCARTLNCVIPKPVESHLVRSESEKRGLPSKVGRHSQISKSKSMQATSSKSQSECEFDTRNFCSTYTKRPPLVDDIKVKLPNASASCSELSDVFEDIIEEDKCNNFRNVSHRSNKVTKICKDMLGHHWHEKAPDVDWNKNNLKYQPHNERYLRVLRMQKHYIWLSEYMKYMVSRRMHS